MSREIDTRNPDYHRGNTTRESELRARTATLSDVLPGRHRLHVERMDTRTGNPALIVSDNAPAESGNFVQRALNHVQGMSRSLGFTPTQPAEYTPDPNYLTTSSGAVTVHLQQQLHGVPVFGAAEAVRFSPDGRIRETSGVSITLDFPDAAEPKLSVQEAVLKAAEHLAVADEDEKEAVDQFGQPLDVAEVDISGFQPKVISVFNQPDRATVLDAGPFEEAIQASLIWFPLDDRLRLCWQTIMSLAEFRAQYRTLVDAETGEILFCKELMHFIVGRGNVYRLDGRQAREMTDFPRPLDDYNLPIPDDLPNGFPDHWLDTAKTSGNSVHAHLGSDGPTLQADVENNIAVFDPADAQGDEQKILNIFYFNNFMHDYFYLLGFRETTGNFQRDNFNRGGRSGDHVDARAHSGTVQGTANMATPIDGSSPIMNMGLVTSTNRHTAFDASVVFHEFTHGVTNRLVGGVNNAYALNEPQSGGMGEGWSDYFACTVNESNVVGDWLVDNIGGIRGYPYDANFPDTFANLGTDRYDGRAPHPIGEIWCAALLEINREIGAQLGAQLVVDALKSTAANPSFLDARDAMLTALKNMQEAGKLTGEDYTTKLAAVWQVFARFGMGPNASSNGAQLTSIIPDFNPPGNTPTPPDQPGDGETLQLKSQPNKKIPDANTAGISDVIAVTKAGAITGLSISVDIEHTYIGDLIVSLVAPNGKTALLHNRNGGGNNNLIYTYHSDDFPDLNDLLGDNALGDWALQVSDHATQDIGTLRQWQLDLTVLSSNSSLQGDAVPGIVIPDNNPNGVTSSINILDNSQAAIKKITVSVDITHTYIADLRVSLQSPEGDNVLLHDHFGGSDDNLIRSYDSANHSALAALLGQSANGEWTLQVSDLAGQDIGKLNQWELIIDI